MRATVVRSCIGATEVRSHMRATAVRSYIGATEVRSHMRATVVRSHIGVTKVCSHMRSTKVRSNSTPPPHPMNFHIIRGVFVREKFQNTPYF